MLRVTEEEIKTIQNQIRERKDIDLPGKVYFQAGFIIGVSNIYDQIFKIGEIGLRGSSHPEATK